MTNAEAFRKLVAAYGLKFRIGKDNTHHYVTFPVCHCKNKSCVLSDSEYEATLSSNYKTNLFGDKSLCLLSLNEIIQAGLNGNLCRECADKFRRRLIDYKSVDELDIQLTLAGANRK